MCLIAYQPAGSPPLQTDWIANGWAHNKDGAGYMFVANGKLIIRKPFFKRQKLAKAYAADHAQYGASSAFVVHFRYATHGGKADHNIHPHILAGGRAGLVHNGILDQFEPCSSTGDISDTALFCRTVLAMREPAQLTSEPFNGFLAEMIGKFNKLVLMDDAGNVSIVNSDLGTWHGDYWFSNHGYAAPPKYASFAGTAISTVTGIARGLAFGGTPDAARLPVKYQPPALPPASEGLFGTADDEARWAALDLEECREELRSLEWMVDRAPAEMTDDEWDRYAELCGELYDNTWEREREYELAMRRDSN